MELTKELVAKAKEAKTPEELMALAKENGIGLTRRRPRRTLTGCIPRPASFPTASLTMYRAAAAVAMTPADRNPDSLWAKPYYTSIAGWEQPG